MTITDFQCSYFPLIDKTTNGTTINVQQFLSEVTNPNKPENDIIEEYRLTGNKEKKNLLSLALFHAITKYRKGTFINFLTGLMLFDFDNVKNPKTLQQMMDHFRNDPHVLFFFVSPSGIGLKVCYYTDIADRKLYTSAYKHMISKLKQNELLRPYIDSKTSDLARGCFISYDPNPYINDDVQMLKIATDFQIERITRHHSFDSPQFCYNILDSILQFYRSNETDAMDDYREYILCGYALFTTLHWNEELAECYYREFCQLSDTFEEDNFQKTVASIKQNNRKDVNLSSLVRYALERGFKTSYTLSEIDFSAFSLSGIRVQWYPNALSITKYLSELELDTSKNLYIISPTGSGKTEYFFRKQKGKRILLVPYISLAVHLANKYSKQGILTKAIYGKIVPDGNEEILVGTYNAISKFNELCKTRDYQLWIDECHNFITASNKNYRNEVMNHVYRSIPYYKCTIAMTGTDIPNDIIFTEREGFTQIVVEQKEKQPKKLYLVETDDIKTSIFNKIQQQSDKQHIIFYNNKERGEDLKIFFEKNGYKSQLYNSDVKDSKDSTELVESGKINKDFTAIIVTSIFIEGLNVTEHNIGAIHLYEDATHAEIVQLASRTRQNAPPIYLYLKRGEQFYYDDFNFDDYCKGRIGEAEALIDMLEKTQAYDDGFMWNYEEEMDINRMILKNPIMDSIHAPLGTSEVDHLSIMNQGYELMRRSQYTDIRLLLYALAPYGFTFEPLSDDEMGESEKIRMGNQHFSNDQINCFIQMKQNGNASNQDNQFTEREWNKLSKRWEILSCNVKDGQVPELMRIYGKSKKDMASFQKKLKVQIYYAKSGIIRSAISRNIKIDMNRFLHNVHKSFRMGLEYNVAEIVDRITAAKNKSMGYEDVTITNKNATAILKKVFEVTRRASDGQYFFTLQSYNVTGADLDYDKINAGAPMGYDVEVQ